MEGSTHFLPLVPLGSEPCDSASRKVMMIELSLNTGLVSWEAEVEYRIVVVMAVEMMGDEDH